MSDLNLEELEKVVKNPYDNVYWFARMFINSDKYAGVGNNSQLMHEISSAIASTVPGDATPEDLAIAKEAVYGLIRRAKKRGTKDYERMEALCQELDKYLLERIDFLVLALTLEHVIIPTNGMLPRIPDSDREFAESVVTAYLKLKGERGVQDVINLWDNLGTNGCLAAERKEIVNGLGALRTILERLNHMSEVDKDSVISAFVQEFERRVGQKRKGRAGRSLEDVTGFILNYFGVVKEQLAPEHLRTSLEVDKLVQCRDGYFIGIGCKRTFRERWKQQITTDVGLLDKMKVKQLWHVITYDRDLSDDKIAEIGAFKGVLYLPDESPRFKSATQNPKLRNFVRPLSRFVADLRTEVELKQTQAKLV
jgi:hypothetical protein